MLKHLPLLDPKIDKFVILGVGRLKHLFNFKGFRSLSAKEKRPTGLEILGREALLGNDRAFVKYQIRRIS